MNSVKTSISLPEPVFAAIEARAQDQSVSRSAIVLEALEEYLRRTEGEDLTRRLNIAYGDDALSAEDKAWIDDNLDRQLRQLREEDGGWPQDA
jgi:Arc/MetJ-type ribon-helix-helix transcriptional regulator